VSTREFQLLLHSARSRPDAGRIGNLVQQGINWQTLLELARRHHVQPLVIRSLKLTCWDAVPSTQRVELESSSRAIAVKNLLCTGELFRLLDAFGKNGIAAVAFKGPVLAELVYGDLFLREFADLDILVHQADVCKAEKVLIAGGYQSYDQDKDYRSAFLSYYGQQPFWAANGVMVDLHWRLASKNVALPIRLSAVWEKLQKLMILGRNVPTLAWQDLPLFLAAHGTMHGWGSLIWLCDFAELLHKRQDIDWGIIFHRAERAHSSRPLLLAMFLASTMLDAPAPTELIIKARESSAVQALVEKAHLEMLRPPSQGDLGEFLWGLKTHDLLRHRLRPLTELAVTRTVNDYWAMPLPKTLWGVYYLTRPFRIAGRMAGNLTAFLR
jgi:Uncharacterised nucleotidyltransferase